MYALSVNDHVGVSLTPLLGSPDSSKHSCTLTCADGESLQPYSVNSATAASDAEPVITTQQPFVDYQIVEHTTLLAEEADTLAQQATMLAARATEHTKSLGLQAICLAEEKAALLDLMHDSIFVRDRDDRITFWNQGAANTYGWTEEQALGQVSHDLLQTQFPMPFNTIKATLLVDGHWEGELTHKRADQSPITMASRWVIQRDSEGNQLSVLEVNNDITQHKRIEDDLRISEERLTLLIQGGKNHAIFMLDTEGVVVTWNEGAQRIKGYTSPEIIGKHFSCFYTAEDKALCIPDEALRVAREAGCFESEGWRVRKDGSQFWASVIITALLDKAGHLRGFGKVARDFSDHKAAEMLLEETRQEQMRLKDEFLSHVSHELRSPLAAIDSFSSIIADGLAGQTTTDQDKYLDIILKNAAQLKSMIEDLLDVTRVKSGQLTIDLERVAFHESLIDALNTLKGVATAKEVTIETDCAANLPEACADKIRLLQVLIILFDNAIKFTSPGGAIKVEAKIFEQDPQFLLVQISDTGCGIDPQSLEHIFEHHYQACAVGLLGRRGLGLGLHIAKNLVHRQGGAIWASSEPHRGSTFSFTLPLCVT